MANWHVPALTSLLGAAMLVTNARLFLAAVTTFVSHSMALGQEDPAHSTYLRGRHVFVVSVSYDSVFGVVRSPIRRVDFD